MDRPRSDPPQHALTKRRVMVGCREGVIRAFGLGALEGVRDRLPEEVRRSSFDPEGVADGWVPTDHFIAWHDAVWEGPAKRSLEELERWARCRIDYGFGVVRRGLLRLGTPAMFAARAPELWRADHSQGDVTAQVEQPGSAIVTLRNHVYATNLLTRASLAEVWRHMMCLMGYRNAKKRHWVDEPGAFSTRVIWEV